MRSRDRSRRGEPSRCPRRRRPAPCRGESARVEGKSFRRASDAQLLRGRALALFRKNRAYDFSEEFVHLLRRAPYEVIGAQLFLQLGGGNPERLVGGETVEQIVGGSVLPHRFRRIHAVPANRLVRILPVAAGANRAHYQLL